MNLTKLKKYLRDWYSANPFVNTVIISNKDDYSANRDINYPVIHVEYVNSSVNSAYNTYIFSFTVGDIQENDIENRNIDDIHNDCQLLAQDFIDYHSEFNENFEIDENIQINPFYDKNGDRTAGVTFAVRFNVFREKNTCIIPIIEKPTVDKVKNAYKTEILIENQENYIIINGNQKIRLKNDEQFK